MSSILLVCNAVAAKITGVVVAVLMGDLPPPLPAVRLAEKAWQDGTVFVVVRTPRMRKETKPHILLILRILWSAFSWVWVRTVDCLGWIVNVQARNGRERCQSVTTLFLSDRPLL